MSDRLSQVRPGVRFVVTAGLLSVALFGILRLPQVEEHLLLPFTKAQHSVACRIGGNPDAPIAVGLSCSAADVIALCLGFVLAFPVAWRRRFLGAALGLLFIAVVNTVRIATLSHAVFDVRWFDLLHVYIWPGALLVIVSLFVFVWMHLSLKAEGSADTPPSPPRGRWALPPRAIRFGLLTFLFVALFVGSSGWWMQSPTVLVVANWVAATGAWVIRAFGGEATVSGNVLRTANGGFLVTQECIMTPLIPAYLAAALSLPMTGWRRGLALVAALPLFFALGAARLLVLAFPARLVGSHLIAIHGFYQVLLAVMLVVVAAYVSSRRTLGTRPRMGALGLALVAGTATAVMTALTYSRIVFALVSGFGDLIGHGGHDYADPQGVLRLLVPYQFGLLVALWVVWCRPQSWRRLLVGVAALAASHPIVILLAGESGIHTGLEPHVAALRAWSVISALFVGAWIARETRPLFPRRALHPAEATHG